ncbi:hypothetical protein D3C75_995890 [compost metagenome]
MVPLLATPLRSLLSRRTLPARIAAEVLPCTISLVRLICQASTVIEVDEVGCSTMPTE